MPPSPVEELALLDLDRSNKGASKQRRDQINAEIALMRDLLPLPETARQRLSQLQIMSLSCVYIRKCNVLQKLFRSFPAEKDVPSMCDFFQALTGFLLITTREGKLVYISENVTDYLGHSMVDMKTQGDSLYDIVDKRDLPAVQAQLLQGGAEPDVTRDVAFFCRMNMSRTLKRQAGFGDVKVMHVRGHFLPLSDPDPGDSDLPQQHVQQKYVFMATCSPLITPELKETLIQSNTMVFKTVHGLDMNYMEVTKTAEYHLGYTTEELCQKSWYSMLHPEDIHEAREKHILLIRSSHEMGCMMTVRLLNMEGAVLWVNIVMHVRQATSTHNDDPLIVCINQVISEEEAFQIRMQSHMFTLYPPRTSDLWSSGLTSNAALPQPPQPDARWMSTMAPPNSVNQSYQSPVASYYMGSQQPQQQQQQQQQHGAMPACSATPMTYHQPMADQGYMHLLNSSSSSPSSSISSASPPAVMPPLSPLGGAPQTQDKLKLMLKRKLQGPCRLTKIPKLVWEEQSDGGMDYASSSADPMHSPGSSSFMMSGSSGLSGMGGMAYNWTQSPTMQVAGITQYRMAHIMPAALRQQIKANAVVLPRASMCSPSLSPPLSISPHTITAEQVVPESMVAVVPDSYLTPDPSPSNSPVPHSAIAVSSVKIENDDEKTPSTYTILQELEKLANLKYGAIKKEQKPARKELPVMDAFDIESFFSTLNCPDDGATLADSKSHEQVCSLKLSQPEAVPKGNVPLIVSQMPLIKQEPADTDASVPAAPQRPKQQQVLSQQPAAKGGDKKPQPINHCEMEELLSFFSGDMTATQLDINDTLIGSSGMKDEEEICSMGSPLSGWTRPQEDFSPGFSTSEATSDLSGDEDYSSSCSEPLKVVLAKAVKQDPSSFSPSHPSAQALPQRLTPQEVPGIQEEDELHQLHYKLDTFLSSIASESGMML